MIKSWLLGILLVFSVYAQNVTGPIEPKPENLIAPGHDWPQWRGPYGSFAAVPFDHQLVSSPQDIRLVWKSEESTPDGRNCNANPKGCNEVNGGYASPVLSEGKIYLFYFLPDGKVIDNSFGPEAKWSIGADDYVICIDAQTGKTIWKKKFEGKGINFNGFGKSGPQLTPAVYNNKVYALGTTGRVYCLNASTGDSIWESDIGPRHAMMEHTKKVWLEEKKLGTFNRDFYSNVRVIGGVVVLNDFRRAKGDFPDYEDANTGIIGLDAETGDSLWHKQGFAGLSTTVSSWEHEGNEYIVTANDGYHPSNHIWCLKPKTGEVVWEVPFNKFNANVIIHGDHMIAQTGTDGKKMTCYKLSLTGTDSIWSVSGDYGGKMPAIKDGYVYYQNGSSLVCAKLENGETVNSEYFSELGGGFTIAFGDLVLADYDQSHGGGKMKLYQAGPDFKKSFTFNQWIINAAAAYQTSMVPVAADGRLFVRMVDHIACYDFRKNPQPISIRFHPEKQKLSKPGMFPGEMQFFHHSDKGRLKINTSGRKLMH